MSLKDLLGENYNFSMAVPKVEAHNKECLTVEECAGVFGIGENTLRKLIARNPRADYLLRIGNKYLFKKDKFKEYINAEYELY